MNQLLLKLIISWRLVAGLLLILATLAVKSPDIDRAFQEAQVRENALKAEQARLAEAEARQKDADLAAKRFEIAKTRILSGSFHRVWNYQNDPKSPPIQIKEGEIYYGHGSSTPLAIGTVVVDAFCGTGVVGKDYKLTDYASAQGGCLEIWKQLEGKK